MIPRTFPSSVASLNGATQMIVYFLPSVTGLTRWVDYIPVQYSTVNTSTTENTYNQDGYIPVTSLSDITGMTPFKEYVPVYIDTAATDVWKVNITGFIPVGTAGIGGSALSLNFAGMSTLDPRITFSRTSNATLTGSDGLIQYAPHNLLTYSEQFDNAAWTKSNASISANTVLAPNGTATADKAVENTALSTHGVSQTFTLVAGTTYSISVYAKTAERTCFTIGAGSLVYGFFNLSTGVATPGVGNANNIVISASASDVGNGWYRCTVAVTRLNTNLTTGPEILLSNTTTPATGSAVTYTGDGTSGLYIWGAQLNVDALQSYNPTTVKNLLGYTQEFDNAAWTKSNSTVTANATTAPDGSVSADKLVENTAAASSHFVQQNFTGSLAPHTWYVYAKAGERSWLCLNANDATNRFTFFNLSNGTIGTNAAGNTANIQPVGNGWYLCSVTRTPANSALSMRLFLADTDNSTTYTGDGTSGIYIWGAQLSDSASVDPYVYNPVAAPSAAAYYGPRFDYDPITLAPKGLLIEEQRTNLVLNSDTLATQNVTVSAVAYTLSFYGTGTVTLSGVSTAGPLVGTGAYPNRVTLTFTPTAGTLTLTVTGSVRYAQLEAGAFATSYIPTVASQVTRSADIAQMIGANFSNWYNQSAGTMYAEASTFAYDTARVVFEVGDGTLNNRITLSRSSTTTTGVGSVNVGGVAQASFSAVNTFAANSYGKEAIAYATNDFAFSGNGSTPGTDTSGTVPVVDRAQIGATNTSAVIWNGWVKRIAYYNRRLSNSELQSVTT